ncbi:hypothetical protein ACIQWB_00355 [Streptomyces olivaceus]|uniref:hypothetical protein n=1 Tax=Streptomyces olivaceus TaxID=47716 RepID=UPI00382B2322
MSRRQTQKMLGLMASGEPVQLTSPMASVKKLAKLAFTAQQFGYEYADARQGGGTNGSLTMLLVPDPSPQARSRAAQNWAQYPNAGDGVSLPPLVPDAFELLKARINFDLTGKNAQKRMGFAVLGATVGCAVLGVRAGGESEDFVMAGIFWVVVMVLVGVGFLVTRARNEKFAARLQAAGFVPAADETGRVRYLPPGGQFPGHGNPFGAAAPGGYATPAGYAQPAPGGGYGQPPTPAGYVQPATPAGYAQPPASAPYAPQPQGAYAPPHQPYAPQQPQGYPAPQAQPPYPPQAQQPYAPQQPHPQQNPHWQPQQPPYPQG